MDELRERLREVWEELDEHLDTLNQNTTEIASVYEYLSELDMKIDKIAERLDALQAQSMQPVREIRLTPKEEEVLRALVEAREPLTSASISRQIGSTGDLVAQTLYCLKQKGVPVRAHTIAEHTFYVVDEKFRVLHQQEHGIFTH